MARLAWVRSRLTYANSLATIALFSALGGGAYAAVAVPANSVSARQLAFPLGMKTALGSETRLQVFFCPPGSHCRHNEFRSIVSLRVSLKKPTRLLVLGQTQARENRSPSHGQTMLGLGVSRNGTPLRGESYELSTRNTTFTFYETIRVRAGHHTLGLDVITESSSGPSRTAQFTDPQITVIALPGLH